MDLLYPSDPDGSRPIAYLWARTVRCEAPKCGAEIPLVRSFWLCKKASRERALRYEVVRPKGKPPQIEFEIFQPKKDGEVLQGTVSRAKATCPCCNAVLQPDRVRTQLSEQRGGTDAIFNKKGNRIGGARLLAIVILKDNITGRQYRLATRKDYEAVHKAQRRTNEILDDWKTKKHLVDSLCPVPDEPLPPKESHRAVGSQLPLYGFKNWGDLFTARQKLSLAKYISEARNFSSDSTAAGSAQEIAGLAISRFSDICNAFCTWESTKTQARHLFTRQALPMVWDFAEPDIFGDNAGNYQVTLDTMARVIERLRIFNISGQVQQADACESPLPDRSCSIWFTDPPYYDAVPYADLSDFFFVWLKRALPHNSIFRDLVDTSSQLTPKAAEAVQNEGSLSAEGKPKDRDFYEQTMARAFAEGRRVLEGEGIGSVVFAHKTTEGWEALLSGIILGGWVITGSWPITTELANRLRARETASLAASIHLICRPRPENAKIGDWDDVRRELPKRVGDWMERLQSEGIRGADLVFACIGPALELYSQYSKVVDPDDREIPLGGDPEATEPHERGFLSYVWEVVGRTALQQILGTAEAKARNSAAGAIEEDARLTALFLWTLQSTESGNGPTETGENGVEETIESDDEEDTTSRSKSKGFSLPFDVARRFAQPLGIHLDEWEDRIIETKKGVVRLLSIADRAEVLFGEETAEAMADRFEEQRRYDPQQEFDFIEEIRRSTVPKIKGRRKKKRGASVSDESLRTQHGATTLDRVHAAMLMQAGGRTNALRAMLEEEQRRGQDFLRLANALSALYPRGSEELRLLEAMLLAVPR